MRLEIKAMNSYFKHLSLLFSCIFFFSQVAGASPGFAGEDTDPNTGRIFLRARYYDPETGTYLTKDPLGISGGVNTYQYCGSNPVNATDPNGEFAFWDTVVAAGIGAVVGVTARFAVDVVHVANGGQWSSGSQYLGAAAGGAAFGATLTIAPTLAGSAGSAAMNAFVATTAAGVVGGATGNLVTQGANNLTGAQQGFNSTSFYLDTSVGGLSAGLFSVGGSTLTPVLQQALNSTTKGTIGEYVGMAADLTEGNIPSSIQTTLATGSRADMVSLDGTIFGCVAQFVGD